MNKLKDDIIKQVWLVPPRLSKLHASVLYTIRLFWIVCRGFVEDRCLLRAQALVYTTLLSIVPLIAVALSIFKGMGGVDKNRAMVEDMLSGLLVEGIQDKVLGPIFESVENINSGAMGGISLVFLIFTVLSLMGTIEKALNMIWGVHQSRTFFAKTTSYWTIVTLGPLLLTLSMSLTASMQSSQIFAFVASVPILGPLAAYGMTFVSTMMLFFLLYMYMPNTRVKFTAALFGAFLAGVLFELAKWGYAQYVGTVMGASSGHLKVYGGLAALPVFLLWLYLLWSIVLLGAEGAFAFQNLKTFAYEGQAVDSNFSSKHLLGVALCAQALKCFHGKPVNWNHTAVAEQWDVPVRFVSDVLNTLVQEGILKRSDETPAIYLPAQPPETITLDAIRVAMAQDGYSAINTRNEEHFESFVPFLNRGDVTLSELVPQESSDGGQEPQDQQAPA